MCVCVWRLACRRCITSASHSPGAVRQLGPSQALAVGKHAVRWYVASDGGMAKSYCGTASEINNLNKLITIFIVN